MKCQWPYRPITRILKRVELGATEGGGGPYGEVCIREPCQT